MITEQSNVLTGNADKCNIDPLARLAKMNLVGGHINQIQIESESVLVKKTSPNEIL